MDFKTFISRLEEVRDIGRIENGYSHIICEIMYYNGLNAEEYMLIDTSTYWRTETNVTLLGENVCAVPDFVITDKTNKRDEIERYGCIEVKFVDKDVDDASRLGNTDDQNGYLESYNNHVIYTNGWKWNYYDGSRTDDGKAYKACWKFDFSQEEQRNAVTYYDLLKKLNEIDWKEKRNSI